MKSVKFQPRAYEDFCQWTSVDIKIFNRILELVKEIDRTPFYGKGKPEPLRYEFKGYWSRRITEEHRLVYKVSENEIYILSCRGHYGQ